MIMQSMQELYTKMQMRKLILILGIIFLSISGYAQPDVDGYDRYKSRRISFMSEKMGLTPDQAQDFWPIYNEYEKKRFDIQQERRKQESKVQDNFEDYSENDFKKLNNSIIDLYVDEANLMKEYNDRFLKILPAKKVVVIGKLENDFRFNMIREYSRQRGGGGN